MDSRKRGGPELTMSVFAVAYQVLCTEKAGTKEKRKGVFRCRFSDHFFLLVLSRQSSQRGALSDPSGGGKLEQARESAAPVHGARRLGARNHTPPGLRASPEGLTLTPKPRTQSASGPASCHFRFPREGHESDSARQGGSEPRRGAARPAAPERRSFRPPSPRAPA